MNTDYNGDIEIFDINDYLDTKKSRNKNKNNLLIFLLVIIIVIFCTQMYKLGTKNNYNKKTESISSELKLNETTKDVTVSSLTFHIPSNIEVQTYDNYLTLEDESENYLIRIDIKEADFQVLLSNYTSLKVNQNADYSSKPKLKKYEEKEYITIETTKNLGKILMAITDAKDNKILIVSVINRKNTYDYELLKIFVPIINSIS